MAEQTESPPPTAAPPQIKLTEVEINGSENIALNLMVSFLGLAQRRGVFALDEAAKIYECVKVFQKGVSLDIKEK